MLLPIRFFLSMRARTRRFPALLRISRLGARNAVIIAYSGRSRHRHHHYHHRQPSDENKRASELTKTEKEKERKRERDSSRSRWSHKYTIASLASAMRKHYAPREIHSLHATRPIERARLRSESLAQKYGVCRAEEMPAGAAFFSLRCVVARRRGLQRAT